MSEKEKVLADGQVIAVDSYPRFETVEAVLNGVQRGVQHDRFSIEYEDEEQDVVRTIAIQAFEDEESVNTSWGIRLDPVQIDEYITALEMIRFRLKEDGHL